MVCMFSIIIMELHTYFSNFIDSYDTTGDNAIDATDN